MLNILVMLSNIGVQYLMYQYVTHHNLIAAVVGFIGGMTFWFLIQD